MGNSAMQSQIIALDKKVATKSGETPQYLEDITKYIGKQNLLLNGDFEYWYAGTSVAPDAWTSGGTVTRESTTIKRGTYSAKVVMGAFGSAMHQDAEWFNYYQGRTITFSMWVYATVADLVRISIYDGVTETYSSYHPGDSTWKLLTVTVTIGGSATKIQVKTPLSASGTVYLDGAMLVEGSVPYAYTPHPEDHLYEQFEIGVGFGAVITGNVSSAANGIIDWDSDKAYAQDAAGRMYFNVNFQSVVAGHLIVIDEITIAYNTLASGDYITQVAVYRYIPTFSTLLSHTADLGNGTTGDETHNIVDTPVELSSMYGLIIGVYCAGNDVNTDIFIRGFNIKYHVKVHG